MSLVHLASLLVAAVSPSGDWKRLEEKDGLVLEGRPMEGGSLMELRVSSTVPFDVDTLCNAIFERASGPKSPDLPEIMARTVLKEGPNERVVYDQVSAPVVSNRDYAMRITREKASATRCQVEFKTVPEQAPPVPSGFVRMTEIFGAWTFEELAPSKTRATYRIYSDPAGSIPKFIVTGPQRQTTLANFQRSIERTRRVSQQRDAGAAPLKGQSP